MRQRPPVPGFTLLLDPARGDSRSVFRGRCVPCGAVSEGARRGDRRMSRRPTPRPGSKGEVACVLRARGSGGVPNRLRDHRDISPTTVGSRHVRALSCSDARLPLTATCARATSGTPRKEDPRTYVYPRHDCAGGSASPPASIPPIRDCCRANATDYSLRRADCSPPARTRLPGVPPAGAREGLGGMV
jgi:hypothetical protein